MMLPLGGGRVKSRQFWVLVFLPIFSSSVEKQFSRLSWIKKTLGWFQSLSSGKTLIFMRIPPGSGTSILPWHLVSSTPICINKWDDYECLSVGILAMVPADHHVSTENLGLHVCPTNLLLVTFFLFFLQILTLYFHDVVLVVHAVMHLYRWKEKMNLSETEGLSPALQSTGETSQDLKPTMYEDTGSTHCQPFW